MAHTVIDSRGSGENNIVHGHVIPEISPPAASFASELRHEHPSSSVSLISNPYPAVGLWGSVREVINLIGAGLGVGPLGAYHASVVAGENWLRTEIQNQVNTCGGRTNLILIGYSQGAQVTGDVYQRSVSSAEKSDIRPLCCSVIRISINPTARPTEAHDTGQSSAFSAGVQPLAAIRGSSHTVTGTTSFVSFPML